MKASKQLVTRAICLLASTWLVSVAPACGGSGGGGDNGGGDSDVPLPDVGDSGPEEDTDTVEPGPETGTDTTTDVPEEDTSEDVVPPEDVDEQDADEDVEDVFSPELIASGVLGPDGGEIDQNGVRLRVSRGALAASTEIGVLTMEASYPGAGELVVGVLEVGPSAIRLRRAVEICIDAPEPAAADRTAYIARPGTLSDQWVLLPTRRDTVDALRPNLYCTTLGALAPVALVYVPNCEAPASVLCNDGRCVEEGGACADACELGFEGCGEFCLPILTSSSSCGGCGLSCPGFEGCVGGACTCPGDAPVACSNGTCAATEDLCACLPGEFRCADGTCRASSDECDCPAGSNKCFDGSCAVTCVCGDPEEPVSCPNGTCAASFGVCAICPSATPVRCPDGTCAATVAACGGECPEGASQLCPSGRCIAELADCLAQAPCPEGEGYICRDGTCSPWDGSACPEEATCPEERPIRCGDSGICVESAGFCPPLVCPPLTPVLCKSGTCVASEDECP